MRAQRDRQGEVLDPRTHSDYDLDRMLDFVTRPDGQTIDPEYDPVRGRLDSITIQPSGETAVYGYDPVTGKLTSISGPDADLSFVYDGDLLTRETWHWEGGQTTAVERVYDDFLQLESLQVGQQAPVTFEYDDDGLLERAGALDLVRRPDNGLLESTSIGVVDDQWTYNPFGELEHYTANVSGQPVFDVAFPQCGIIVRQSLSHAAMRRSSSASSSTTRCRT